ncbi:hypothetical protein KAS41_03635 [Candidatus Parcubacteria bacterium]|nr:hypothetical protein [Candidatus Parcubacteria bacterium]
MFKKIILFTIIFLSVFSLQFAVVAQEETKPLNLSNSAGFLNTAGDKAGYDYEKKDIDPIIARIIKIWLSVFGIVFLVLIIYGGFIWMTAGGSEEKVTKARQIIINSAIGLAVVMMAYAITWFVVYQLSEATGFEQ